MPRQYRDRGGPHIKNYRASKPERKRRLDIAPRCSRCVEKPRFSRSAAMTSSVSAA